MTRTVLLFLTAIVTSSTPSVAQDDYALSSTSDRGAVILEEDARFEVRNSTDSRYTLRRRIEVSNEDGKEYCQVQIWETDFVKILDLRGAIYDQSGREISQLNKKDVRRDCGQGNRLMYRNACVSSFQLSTNNYPFVVEYEYTIRLKSLFFWPDWSPQNDISVKIARYDLDVPRGFLFRTKTCGDAPAPTRTTVKDRDRYTWVAADLPAFVREPAMPPQRDYEMGVRFAPSDYRFDDYDIAGANWQALSASYYQMACDAFKLNDEQVSLVNRAKETSSSDSAMVADLYQRLLEHTRYFAVEVGIGGWQPIESSRTFAHGYGDCKGLSVLHVSMLRHADISAKICLLATHGRGMVDPELASLDWFNHVIYFLLLNADTIWADPTCHECALGDLPDTDEETYALVIDSSGGPLIKTPRSTSKDNAIVRKVDVTINADQSVVADLEVRARGNSGHAFRRLLIAGDADDRARWSKDRLFGFGNEFSVVRCEVTPPSITVPAGTMRTIAKAEKYVHLVDGKAYMNPSVLSLLSEAEDVDLAHRKYPLDIGYPLTLIDTIVIELPPGCQIVEAPDDSGFEDEFGALRIDWAQEGDKLVCVRERRQNRYQIDPTEIDKYVAHRGRIRNTTRTHLVFTRG